MRGADKEPRVNTLADMIYVTNQRDIVEHAKYCMHNYPTIVNNIPKEKNHYSNTAEDKALVDYKIASANMAIGESSNLAQLCLSYTYNYEDRKYYEYVCILSVLAQIAIDNAKRTSDIDLVEEIARIKRDMDIEKNGLPKFWFILQRKNKFSKRAKKKFSPTLSNLLQEPTCNTDLECPMNYLFDLNVDRVKVKRAIYKNSLFFNKYPLELNRKVSKKVEALIEKYEKELLSYRVSCQGEFPYELMETSFEELVEDIKGIYISETNIGLISWLIDRALVITPQTQKNYDRIKTDIHKNRPILLKTLYTMNQDAFLKCFSKNLEKSVRGTPNDF